MKKKLLFVYPHMAIGGSTTSLLSILNLLDYSKYDVDIILGSDRGELLNYIPDQAHHLKQALPDDGKLRLRKLTSPRYLFRKFLTRNKSANVRYQYLNYENARMSRKLTQKYDVAIAFLETYACDYVADFVTADKKIFWLHLDYIGAGFEKEFDQKIYRKFEKIVLVSEICRENFIKVFPELADRAVVIENILSTAYMRQKAAEACNLETDPSYLNLISVCRIDFKHKGLDRGVAALANLKQRGISNVRWYIIGNGPDRERLDTLIFHNSLEQNIFLLGAKINPAPYIRQMDCFFLPSRYEGKPMAVTEAMMLGVPPLVTRYASADEQIHCGKNGLIAENNDDAICKALYDLACNRDLLQKMQDDLLTVDLSNSNEMEKIYALINEGNTFT